MKTITIRWQRLVDIEGRTCNRCGSTEIAVESAFAKLKQCLVGLGIEVNLEKHRIDQATFNENPLESNMITIEDKTIEEWLGGTTGQSDCCGPCGDNECRTITIDDQTLEEVPESLIIRAGLLAGADKLKK